MMAMYEALGSVPQELTSELRPPRDASSRVRHMHATSSLLWPRSDFHDSLAGEDEDPLAALMDRVSSLPSIVISNTTWHITVHGPRE